MYCNGLFIKNRRKQSDRRTICSSPFAGKIICGDCGEIFGSKVWHSNSKYRRTIWQCNAKFKGDCKCKTPHLYEDDIKDMFVVALSKLMKNREALLEDGRLMYNELSDTAEIDKKCEKLLDEIDVTKELIAKLIKENAAQAQNQEDYLKKYESLAQRHEKLKSRYEILSGKRERRLYQADTLSETFKHRFGGECLAQVVDTTECVRTHRHCDALQEQGFTFFEKLANSVDKRKQRCREWYQFCYPHTNQVYVFRLILPPSYIIRG